MAGCRQEVLLTILIVSLIFVELYVTTTEYVPCEVEVMSRKLLLFFSILSLSILPLLSSCSSTASMVARAEDGPPETVPEEELPEWVRRHPGSVPEFYIGIGSSNTGDRQKDRTLARETALVELSSSISTQIESEIIVDTRDTGEEIAEEIRITIRERVKQRLIDYEQFDSFFSDEEGYWVYLHLSKEAFNRQKQALQNRVVGMVSTATDTGMSAADSIALLSEAWGLVFESPWAGTMRVGPDETSGALIDRITGTLRRYVSSISLQVPEGPVVTQVEEVPRFMYMVANDLGLRSGRFRLELERKEKGGGRSDEFRSVVTTDGDGRYEGSLDGASFPLGLSTLVCRISSTALGLPEQLKNMVILPEQEIPVEARQRAVRLVVESTGIEGGTDPSVYGTVRSLFSKKLPFQITDDAATTIRVALQFRQAPKNDYDLIIMYAGCNFTVFEGERNLYSYQIGEVKEGGLDTNQARSRGVKKLMEMMESDNRLFSEIENAVRLQ